MPTRYFWNGCQGTARAAASIYVQTLIMIFTILRVLVDRYITYTAAAFNAPLLQRYHTAPRPRVSDSQINTLVSLAQSLPTTSNLPRFFGSLPLRAGSAAPRPRVSDSRINTLVSRAQSSSQCLPTTSTNNLPRFFGSLPLTCHVV